MNKKILEVKKPLSWVIPGVLAALAAVGLVIVANCSNEKVDGG